jgi:3-hydroxyisobutyrate dehydrogenase-like beta-hydroxyacid dehydrogenase
MTTPAARVAVFGLGEAGAEIAADLVAAGATVRGFDPAPVPTPAHVARCDDPREAVVDADVVLAVTAAHDADTALRQALDAIPRTALYADLSTSSAVQERHLAGIADARGLRFADVALMSTVPGTGIQTPQLASGSGAERYAELLGPLGAAVTVVGVEAGDAAARKLLRSVLMKGLAALVIESLRAGQAAGLGDWVWEHLVTEIGAADEDLVRRLVDGTEPHAVRRRHEMEAAASFLAELGVDPVMTRATVETLSRVPSEGVPDLPRRTRP